MIMKRIDRVWNVVADALRSWANTAKWKARVYAVLFLLILLPIAVVIDIGLKAADLGKAVVGAWREALKTLASGKLR